jgi:transposase-like protein
MSEKARSTSDETRCPACNHDDIEIHRERRDVKYSQRWYWVVHYRCRGCGVTWERVQAPDQ